MTNDDKCIEKNPRLIKNISTFWQISIDVYCYMVTGHIECLIMIEEHNICHEDMTGKRGKNVTG